MGAHKTAKLFMHGGSQAVRLPKEFRFEGQEVRIRKEGERVILEPGPVDWKAIWEDIDRRAAETGELFPERPEQPPFQERESLDD
jgi:antitoxin VapB